MTIYRNTSSPWPSDFEYIKKKKNNALNLWKDFFLSIQQILQVNHTTGQLHNGSKNGGKLTGGKSIHNAAIGSRSQLTGPPTSSQMGLHRGRSSHQALTHRRQSIDIMRDGGVGQVPGSRHTSNGISPHMSYELTQGPPPVHQPAGYGHTIKEQVNREGLNKKRPSHRLV